MVLAFESSPITGSVLFDLLSSVLLLDGVVELTSYLRFGGPPLVSSASFAGLPASYGSSLAFFLTFIDILPPPTGCGTFRSSYSFYPTTGGSTCAYLGEDGVNSVAEFGSLSMLMSD